MEVYIESKDVHVRVNKVGQGKPIFFLQGERGSELQSVSPLGDQLGKSFELIVYEHVSPTQNTEQSLEEEVELINELRIKLGLEKINLFGESWGSVLALLYAVRYSEHVEQMFLTGAVGASYESFSLFETRMQERAKQNDVQKFVELTKHFQQGEDSIDNIFHMLNPYYSYTSQASGSSMIHADEVVNKEVGMVRGEHFDLRDELHLLKDIPVLVAQGTHDILSPLNIQLHLIEYLPQASLVEIEDAGHWAMVDQPEQVVELFKTFFSEKHVH